MHALNQRLITGSTDSHESLHSLFCKAARVSSWYFGNSDIHGQGIFAGVHYDPGDEIGVAMTPGDDDEFGSKIWNLTPLARWCNHQMNANAELKKINGNFSLVATQPIEPDEEIFANYAQVTRAVGSHSRMQWEGKDIPNGNMSDYKEKE